MIFVINFQAQLDLIFHLRIVVKRARATRGLARGGPEHCRTGRAGLHSRNQQPDPNPFTNRVAHGPPTGSPRADLEMGFRALSGLPAGLSGLPAGLSGLPAGLVTKNLRFRR
ncbi:hypothetical protein PGTUg99_029695 [Puccinia graminis f. sp. tritici]|uniref:Uncharacterized protein n=1 Tax=Puccinia graminis f. sp. tritici TaxID=56615 RepID=A0A5B0S2Z0_PUCGR|nr:hypothetical protein PGTUg99_029695 [Puccinia graminis f. sp. tritici]